MLFWLEALRRKIDKSRELLRKMAAKLPLRSQGGALLDVVRVSRSLRALAGKREHEGAAVAQALWTSVSALMDEWQSGSFDELLGACVSDLSEQAHTLALNIHRALLAMGEGTIENCTALQVVLQCTVP